MSSIWTLFVDLKVNAGNISSQIASEMSKASSIITQKTASISQSVSKFAEDNARSFQNMAAAWTAWFLAVASVGTMAVKSASRMQELRTELNVLTWSAERGKKLFSEIQKEAAKTPFETAELASATRTMLWFWVAQEEVISSMRMLWDISGGNNERFQSLALVFWQVRAAWKLTWQDLLQFVNNWFNPLQAIAEKTGKTMSELKDEVSAWKITFEQVAEAMKTATSEWWRYFWLMEAKSKTFWWVMSTLRDNVSITLAALWWFVEGEVVPWWLLDTLTQIVNKINPELQKLVERASQNPEIARNVFLTVWAITALVAIIGTLWLVIPSIVAWFWFIVTAVTAVWAAFLAVWWPITLLIAWIIAISVAIYKNRDLIVFKTNEMWNLVKEAFSGNTEAIKIILENAFLLMLNIVTFWMSSIVIRILWWRENVKSTTYSIFESIWLKISSIFNNIKWIVTSAIDYVIWKINSVAWVIASIQSKISEFKASVWDWLSNLWFRADWWPVSRNMPYIVWERWPELFVPNNSWKIIPNNQITNNYVNVSWNGINAQSIAWNLWFLL